MVSARIASWQRSAYKLFTQTYLVELLLSSLLLQRCRARTPDCCWFQNAVRERHCRERLRPCNQRYLRAKCTAKRVSNGAELHGSITRTQQENLRGVSARKIHFTYQQSACQTCCTATASDHLDLLSLQPLKPGVSTVILRPHHRGGASPQVPTVKSVCARLMRGLLAASSWTNRPSHPLQRHTAAYQRCNQVLCTKAEPAAVHDTAADKPTTPRGVRRDRNGRPVSQGAQLRAIVEQIKGYQARGDFRKVGSAHLCQHAQHSLS
jgi:hypothetical protein